MATVTWNGAGSSNYWDDVNNWDSTTQPTSSDDVLFNITSPKDCSVNLSPYINSLTFTEDYTGSWVATGFDFTSNGNVLFDKSGTLTLGTGLYLVGDGTCRFASSIGTLSATSCALRLDGTVGSFLYIGKAITTKSFTLGSDATVSLDGIITLNVTGNTPLLTMMSRGSLEINSNLILNANASGDFYSFTGSPVITGSSGFTCTVIGADVTANIPALNYTGISTVMFRGSGANMGMALNFTGDITSVGNIVRFRNESAGGSTTINTNGYSVTVPSFTVGNAAADGTLTVNFGSSIVTCAQRNTTTLGKTYLNFQSSQIYTGTWTNSAGVDIINPGISTLTFNKAATLTSSDQTFYNLIISAGSATSNAVDKVSIADGGKLTVNSPLTFFPTTSTQVLNFAGAYTFDGTGNVTIKNGGSTNITVPALDSSCSGLLSFDTTDSSSSVNLLGPISWNGSISFTNWPSSSVIDVPLIMNGNDTTLSITSGMLKVINTCDFTANGLRTVLTDSKSITLRSLSIGPNASLLTNGVLRTIFSGSSTSLHFGVGSKLTNNASLLFTYSSSTNSIIDGSDYTWNGTGTVDFAINNDFVSIDVPSISYTGSGGISFRDSGISTDSTFNFCGDISCAALNLDCNQSLSSLTFNMGIYNYSISYFGADAGGLSGQSRIKLQSSKIYCGGSWACDSSALVDPGTSEVNILNTSTVNSGGQPFYSLNLSAGNAKIITVPGTLTIADGGHLSIDSTLNINPTVSCAVPNFLGSYTWDGTGKVTLGGTTPQLSFTVPALNLPDSSWAISPAADSTTTFTGDTTLAGLTVNKGMFSIAGKNLVTYGSVLFDSSNTGLTLGTGIYFKRDCTCRVGQYLEQPITLSSTKIFVDASVKVSWYHNRGIAVQTLTIGPDATFVSAGIQTFTLRDASTPLIFIDGGKVTLNRAIALNLTAPGAIIQYLGRQPIFDGTTNMAWTFNGDGTFSIPPFTCLSTGSPLYMNQSAVQTNSVLNFTGDYSWAAASIYMYATGNGGPNSQAIVNTNGYNLAFNNINWGSASADTTLVMNCGSSTLNGFFSGTQDACPCKLNLQDCTWNVNVYGWEIDPIHIINPGTSTVKMVGTYAGPYIRNKGKSFYNLITQMPAARTVTIDSIGIADGGMFKVNTPVLFSNTDATKVLNFEGSYTFDGTSAITIGGTSDSTISAFYHTGTSDWTVAPPDSSGVCFLGDSTFNSLRVNKGSFTALGGLKSNKSVYFDNTGALTLGSGLYIAGDGTCRLNSVLTTVSSAACALRFDGTRGCDWSDNKATVFKSLTLGPDAKVISNGTTTSIVRNLTFVNNGSLNLLSNFTVRPTSSGDFITPAGNSTITGTATLSLSPGTSDVTAAMQPISLAVNALAYSVVSGAKGVLINFVGDVTNTGAITFGNASVGAIVNYNFGSSRLTAGGSLSFSINGGASATYNLGSARISAGSFTNTHAAGVQLINLQTSQWDVSGSWSYAAGAIVDPGTSIVTFKDATSSSVTSSGKSFYDITVNNPFKAFTFADPTNLHNLTVAAAASYSQSATSVSASGNVAVDSTGTLNLGSSIVMNGNATTFHVGGTVSTVSGTSCAVTINGVGVLFEDNKNVVLKSLILGANADVTNVGSAPSTQFSSGSSPLTFTNNGSLYLLSKGMIFNTTTSVPIVTVLAGTPIIKGPQTINLRSAGAGNQATIPALKIDASTTIITGPANNPFTTLTGDFTCSNLNITSTGAATTFSFSTGGYGLSCSALNVGSSVVGSTLVADYGSSRITCASFDSSGLNSGNVTQNFRGSQWLCGGNWTFKSDHTVSHAWDTVTITSDSTITSAGKPLNNLVINSPNKTVVLADTLVARGYQVISGNLNAGNNLRIRPDSVVTTDILPY